MVISIQGLSKSYQLYERPSARLRQFFYPRLQGWLGRPPRTYYRDFWALRDVSFEVRRGETFGIVGRNGAGKSTLLQLIAGTLNPSQGSVAVTGRVAALLELGSGFNPEFTGRENVYLNAALLGFDRAQTDARFDEIAEFAGIGEFMEQPVKTYSSGMYVRLAFAVSVCVEPDVLIVDEALAVGDAAFQFKCLQRLERMQNAGTTLLFVSHDMGMVQNFCRQAIYLEHGRVKNIGTPEAVAAQYFFDMREEQRQAMGGEQAYQRQTPLGGFPQSAAFGDGRGRITRAVFADSQASREQLRPTQPIEMDIELEYPAATPNLELAVALQNQRLIELAGRRFPLPDNPDGGARRFRIRIDNRFTIGDYFITLRLVQKIGVSQHMPLQSQIAALHFQNVASISEISFLGVVNVDVGMEEVAAPEPVAAPGATSALRIVALLAVRNEAAYMERCLAHLTAQGIDVLVIDNDSTDATVEIARRWLGKGVIGIERHPYPGHYDWQGILRHKAELARSIDADWFIHHDADEIRQSTRPGETLAAAIARLDAAGYNAIDFDEFVFLPLDDAGDAGQDIDYVADLRHAYYFAPRPLHRVNAWKKTAEPVDLLGHGGHQAEFPGRQLSPERLILRHYPFLSRRHLIEKYTRERVYSDYEVNVLGWHGKRANFQAEESWLPPREELIEPDVDGWDTSAPRRTHPFLGVREN
ncbi:ATP-binding cassette domain-containing protein [Denitratisoma sp. DHT3]|uniref:ATP-binding cassette domain-containing protein n=1 Tax=Denitratisoma sp. DHT3 TaxID=1981880 RepID=UPI0021BDEE56|nr:ATP-binding cassette domain-containing protein [Denitratisoma sp. DHT3]